MAAETGGVGMLAESEQFYWDKFLCDLGPRTELLERKHLPQILWSEKRHGQWLQTLVMF